MISHKIISSKNYAYIEIKGRPGVQEFIKAAQRFIDDPEYTSGVHRLCDFSQSNLEHISIENFVEFLEFAKTNISLSRGTRVALVAPDNDHSSIYHSFAEQVDSGTFQVFIEPGEAVKWIKSSALESVQGGNDHADRLLRLG